MVAFICNRPAMFMTSDGWRTDATTDCLQNPADILNYCKKRYPTLDIRNIVEADDITLIKNWCMDGRKRCHHQFKVRPFRCLAGPFQSETLVVPRHCHFEHILNERECKSFDAWNESSRSHCLEKGWTLRSVAVLQPCGIDRFDGAEFVCCPRDDNDWRHSDQTQDPSATSTSGTLSSSGLIDSKSPADRYNAYLHNSAAPGETEHQYYNEAKFSLQQQYKSRAERLMKEWDIARDKVLEMRAENPAGAEKLSEQLAARFRKMYAALEKEGSIERHRLIDVHQQRIQAALNEKKRRAFEQYQKALSVDEPDAPAVLKALKHYIRTEERDRRHTIHHYQHLQETDAEEADQQLPQMADHLKEIDVRLNQALDMLNRVPHIKYKLQEHIERFLAHYQSMEDSLAVILAKAEEQKRRVTTAAASDNVTNTVPTGTIKTGTEAILPATTKKLNPDVGDGGIHLEHAAHVAHFERNSFNMLENYLKADDEQGVNVATPIAIASCSIAVFIVILLGVVIIKRRGGGQGRDDALAADEEGSLSDLHTTEIQLNGYENPTYKYLDENCNA